MLYGGTSRSAFGFKLIQLWKSAKSSQDLHLVKARKVLYQIKCLDHMTHGEEPRVRLSFEVTCFRIGSQCCPGLICLHFPWLKAYKHGDRGPVDSTIPCRLADSMIV